MKINLCNRQEAVLKEARSDKKAEVRYLMKEKQMNKQEANKAIGMTLSTTKRSLLIKLVVV